MAGLVESGIHLFFFAGILLGAMMLAQPAAFQRVVTRGVPLAHTVTPTVTESVAHLLATEIAPATVVCAMCEVCAPAAAPVCECESAQKEECPAQTQTERELTIEERREIVDAAFAMLNNPNPLLVNIGVNGMPFLVSLSSLEESYVKAKALEFCVDNVLKLKIKKEIVTDGCAQAVAKQLFEEIKSNRGVLLSDVVFAENDKPPAMPAPQEPLIKPVAEKTEPLIKPVIEPVVKPLIEPVVKPVVTQEPAAPQREAEPVREPVQTEQEAVAAQRKISFPPGQNVLVEENGRIVLVRVPLRDGPEYALSFDIQTQTLAETVESFCLSFQLNQAQLESCFKTVSVYVKDQLVAAGFVQAPEEQQTTQETQAEAAGEEKAAQETVVASVSDVTAAEAESVSVSVSMEETVSETAAETVTETATESEAAQLNDAETAVPQTTESVVAVANAVVEDSSVSDAETPVSVEDAETAADNTEVAVTDAAETTESTEPAVVSESVSESVSEIVVTEEDVSTNAAHHDGNNNDNTREVHGTVQLGSKRVSLPLLTSLSLAENAQRYCDLHFTESLSRLLRDEGFHDWTEENCAGFLAFEVQRSFVADEE